MNLEPEALVPKPFIIKQISNVMAHVANGGAHECPGINKMIAN